MAGTERTAASRGCSSRCSSPTPARACSRPRWGWRRCSPSRSSWPTASRPRRTGRSIRAEHALAGLESLPFPFPVVVKPSREGSSVGVHICHTEDAYPAAVEDAAKLAGSILVEQFVKGREVQGAVLDDASLGAIEIVPAHEFYDYEAKYTAGSGTKYLFPAPLPPDQYARVNEVCLAAHRALGCRGATRSDVIVTSRRWSAASRAEHHPRHDPHQPPAEDRRRPGHRLPAALRAHPPRGSAPGVSRPLQAGAHGT